EVHAGRVALDREQGGDLGEADVHEAADPEGAAGAAGPAVGGVDEAAAAARHAHLDLLLARVVGADADDGLGVGLDVAVDLLAAAVADDEVEVAHAVVADREDRVALAALELDVEAGAVTL